MWLLLAVMAPSVEIMKELDQSPWIRLLFPVEALSALQNSMPSPFQGLGEPGVYATLSMMTLELSIVVQTLVLGWLLGIGGPQPAELRPKVPFPGVYGSCMELAK